MENLINKIVLWIKDYINNAKAKGVVIGMSGGKDSLIVAKLCAMAIGEENVYGVIMPNGKMTDKNDAINTCKLLNIPYSIINIEESYNNIINYTLTALNALNKNINDVTTINTAPRIRMTTLYAIAGSLNYLVANTSNLSEISVGYTTKWGDSVGDFAPLAEFTKTEVCNIGLALGLPVELVNKVPGDGLTGKSDENNLGFSYEELDNFIRNGTKTENYDIIIHKHKISQHKRDKIAKFNFKKVNYFNK